MSFWHGMVFIVLFCRQAKGWYPMLSCVFMPHQFVIANEMKQSSPAVRLTVLLHVVHSDENVK